MNLSMMTPTVVALVVFISVAAHADSKMPRAGGLECDSSASLAALDRAPSACPGGTQDPSVSDTAGLDRETRMAEDKQESQALVDRLESTYGQAAWYQDADEADLTRAIADASALLAQLSTISEAMGGGPIAQNQSLMQDIADRVAGERACRADAKCMAKRAADKSEEAFRQTVLFPLCDADSALESLRAQGSGVMSKNVKKAQSALLPARQSELRNATKVIAELSAEYAQVRHHPFAGWRTACR